MVSATLTLAMATTSVRSMPSAQSLVMVVARENTGPRRLKMLRSVEMVWGG
jgi:hypothetical protein